MPARIPCVVRFAGFFSRSDVVAGNAARAAAERLAIGESVIHRLRVARLRNQ